MTHNSEFHDSDSSKQHIDSRNDINITKRVQRQYDLI